MKTSQLILILSLLTTLSGLNAVADDDHSADVCSSLNANVCGHIGHMEGFKSEGEAQFVTHLETPQNTAVTDLKVVLWMPSMGHGTSPVTITQMGVNKYKVTQAFFIMPGDWEVRVQFKFGGADHQLNIPVQISQ